MHKPLKARHERFAGLVAQGETGVDAYRMAGYDVSARTAHAASARLLGNDTIKKRIAEIRKIAEDTAEAWAVMSIHEKRSYLAKLVRTPIGEMGPESPFCVEFTEERVVGGACAKVLNGKEVEAPYVIRRKVKIADKLRAIELDSKLAGHFALEQVQVTEGLSGVPTLAEIAERASRMVSLLDRWTQPEGER